MIFKSFIIKWNKTINTNTTILLKFFLSSLIKLLIISTDTPYLNIHPVTP